MSDPPSSANAAPPVEGNTATETVEAPGEAPALPVVRFPPIPPVPEGVKIIPFKDFKEVGIQIFNADDVEVDGLGIPTVPLRVNHNTDKRKSNGKSKPDGKNAEQTEEKNKGKGKRGPPTEKLDPVARAQEQRRQRILLFAKKEWYEQWAEGEDLRGSRTYDQNLSPIDRIHMAATEFRTGRIWPPGYMKVNYLWDQFRLYAGLLGSPPVWTRTDLPQQPDSGDEYDDETDSDVELAKIRKSRPTAAKVEDEEDETIVYSDEEDLDDVPAPRKQRQRHKSDAPDEVDQEIENAKQVRQKRIPPRTPYALYNLVPIPVSSDAEVRRLLALSTARRESRLLKFLADPEQSIRIFLSWHLRHEGLIWSPMYLVSFPHLVSFFLSFLVRIRALPESERGLKKAVEVAKRGIAELGRTGKLCRELPDKFGAGMQAMWGKRWQEDPWEFDFGLISESVVDENIMEETQEEALKRFEEELKVANVQLLPADPVNLGVPSENLDNVEEQAVDVDLTPSVAVANTSSDATVIEVQSPMVPQASEDVESEEAELPSTSAIGDGQKVVHFSEVASADGSLHQDIPSALADAGASEHEALITSTMIDTADRVPAPSETRVVDNEDLSPENLDWSKPDGKVSAADVQKAKDAWAPFAAQPLMELFGMTILPLRFDAGGRGGPNKIGVVERSMRRVKTVLKAGESDRERKWRGLEDDLVGRLSRVVLSPWTDWDDGGVAPDYRIPKVQRADDPLGPDEDEEKFARYAAKYEHDALQDDITLLVEPHVADLVVVGMGMAGTWVQLVPARDEMPRTHSAGNRGRGRGRGRGTAEKTFGSGGRPQKEFTFWYVEDIHMAVPSFWTPGEEEKPITVEDLAEAQELDLEL